MSSVRERRAAGVAWASLVALMLATAPVTAQTGAAGAEGSGGAVAAGTAGAPGSNGTAGANGNAGASGASTGATASPGSNSTGATATPNSGQTGTNTSPASPSANGNAANRAGNNVGGNGVSGNIGTASATPGVNGGQNSLPPAGANGLQVFSLTQAVAAALANSSEVQIAARNVQIDNKRADEARDREKPNLGTSAQATRFDQATKIAIGSSPPIEVVPTHTETLQATLSENFDVTGQIRAATNQARLQALSDQFVLGQAQNERVLSANNIYFNLLRAQHQVQVSQSALATAQRQLTDALNLYQNQVGQRIDVERARTQVAQAQQNLTTALNNQDVARSNFNDLVGRPLDAPVQATDVPGVTVGVDISNVSSVGAPAPLAFNPYTVAPTDVSSIDLGRSITQALAQRPEVLSAQAQVRAAEVGVKLARAGLEPTFGLAANGFYYPTTSFQNPRQRVAAITATLTVPLYDGGETRDRVQEAHLRTQNAQTALDSQRENVTLDVRNSYFNLATAARQIDSANTALRSAIAARQLAQIRYEGQVGTYLEVTDAQAALVSAENAQVDAVYNYLIARAQFANATGRPQTR